MPVWAKLQGQRTRLVTALKILPMRAFLAGHALIQARASTICDRILERGSFMEENPAMLPTSPVYDVVQRHPGNETLLDSALSQIDHQLIQSNMEPHFRDSYHIYAESRQHQTCPSSVQLAVLVSGHMRTMLEADMVSKYAALLREWNATCGYVEVFAYLDLDTEWKSVNEQRIKALGVQAAFKTWGVPFTFRDHHSTAQRSLLPDFEAAGCDPITGGHGTQVLQFAKVQAVTEMMKAAEDQRGCTFDVVVRMRPDMCIESLLRFFEFALRRTNRRSLVSFLVYDAVAVLPRWMADAYASAWRSFGPNCNIDSAWRRPEERESICNAQRCGVGGPIEYKCLGGGDLMAHLLLLGVGAVDLHWFWGGSSEGIARVDDEPKIRRLAGCEPFA